MYRTRSQYYPHIRGQKWWLWYHFKNEKFGFHCCVWWFGSKYLEYFYKWSHISHKSLFCFINVLLLSLSEKPKPLTKKNLCSLINANHRLGLFFPCSELFWDSGKNSPDLFCEFFSAHRFFLVISRFFQKTDFHLEK